MQYYVFLDNCGLLYGIPAFSQSRENSFFYVNGKGKSGPAEAPEGMDFQVISPDSDLSSFGIQPHDRAILHFINPEKQRQIINGIREISENIPILVIETSDDAAHRKQPQEYKDPCLNVISINNFLKAKAQEKWHQIEIKRKIEKLRQAVNPDEPLLILTQPDPDPDAIGSALALQSILGRDDESAPIVTFKKVSRNENINMITILDIPIKKLSPKTVDKASQIAMVDVQPSFFKKSFPNLTVLVDHHPVQHEEKLPYQDIQVTYGATSTIFSEYLMAANISISQKLATALYYGIKTDTFLLGREVSKADFNAFVNLWPKSNLQEVAQMEKPRLKPQELDVYIKALKNHQISGGFLFSNLGKVPKDDLVPRLADFVMEIGKTNIAVVWGQAGEESTFSARSQLASVHAGEVMAEAFSALGSAGGHRSMARATMLTKALEQEFKTRSKTALGEAIRKRLNKIIARRKKAGKTQ